MDDFKNFSISEVATAPDPAGSGTSLIVKGGEGSRFPAVPFNAVVWPAGEQPIPSNTEVVRVTNISTDTFTITREQEGSSARTIVIGDQIAAPTTALTLDAIAVHVDGDGSDHADVATNTVHISSDGSDHAKVTANETAIALNTTHRSSDGSDHSKVTANETAIALNTTHTSSDGSDHGYINQDVQTTASPAFVALALTGNLGITKADPESRLTDSGDSEYTRVTRSDTSGKATRYNQVSVPASGSDTFGDTTIEASSWWPTYEATQGCKFTCTPGGVAESITVYIDREGFWGSFQCAIYDADLNLVAKTEQIDYGAGGSPSWATFDFDSPGPTLTADTVYWLVVAEWGGQAYRRYKAGTTDQAFEVAGHDLPASITPDTTPDYEMSIYCTFAPLPTTQEVKVWSSEDGIAALEEGIQTFGDPDGRTVVQGATQRFFIGATEQIRLIDGALYPITDNDIDLGTATLEFKDLYVDGKAYIDGLGESITLDDEVNIILNTTTGTKIGTAVDQKLGFFNAAPVVQQAYTAVSDPPTQAEVVAIRDCLVNVGLMASS